MGNSAIDALDLINELTGHPQKEDGTGEDAENDGLDEFINLGVEELDDVSVEPQGETSVEPEPPVFPGSIGMTPITAAPDLDPDPTPPSFRGRKKKPGPKPKNPFQEMLPNAHRLMIYKRNNTGQLSFVGEYSPYDLQRIGNVEIFLKEYVVPTYGFGEYSLAIQTPDAAQKPVGSVNIMPPRQQTAGETQAFSDAMKLQGQVADKAKNEAREQMNDMLKMMMAFRGKEGGGGNDTMMMMMMMNMMQAKQQPAVDPMMQMLMQKLLSKMDEPQMAPPAPMPYFPPASSGESGSFKDMVTAVTALMRPTQPTPLADVVAVAKAMKGDDDKLTVKDMISMLPTIKEMLVPKQQGNDSFRKVIEDFSVLQQLISGNGPDTSAGFWEFAGNLAQSLPEILNKEPVQAIRKKKGPLATQAARVKLKPQAAQPSNSIVPLNKEQIKKGAPPIHPGFKKYAVAMKKAFDEEKDGVLMETFLRGLMFLRKTHKKWQASVEAMISMMHSGNKVKALKYVEVFLHTFVDADLCEAEVAEAVYNCFEEHWDKALEALNFKSPDGKAVEQSAETIEQPSEEVSASIVESKVVGGGGPDEPNIDDLDDDEEDEADEDDVAPEDPIDEDDVASAETIEDEDGPLEIDDEDSDGEID